MQFNFLFFAKLIIGVFTVAFCFDFKTEAALIIRPNQNTTIQFDSIATQYDGNNITFAPFNGTIMKIDEDRANVTKKDKILMIKYNSSARPRIEVKLVNAMEESPRALIVFGGLLGNLQYVNYYIESTASITVPVIQITDASFNALAPYLEANNYTLDVTIDNTGINQWQLMKESWFIPFFQATVGGWCIINVILSIWNLVNYQCVKNLAVICLALEVFSNLLRIFFCINPYGPWLWTKTWSRDIIDLFLTASFPVSLATTILLTVYWHELVTSNSMEISPLLTTSKIPAICVIAFITLFEVITACLRITASANGATYAVIIYEAIYFIFIITLVIYYIYVSVKVYKFLNKLKRMKSSQQLIWRVTVRAVASAVGMIWLVISGILILSPWYNTPYGNIGVQYMIFQSLNWISCTQILAFQKPENSTSKSTAKTKSADDTSKTVSGTQMTPRGGGNSSGDRSKSSHGESDGEAAH